MATLVEPPVSQDSFRRFSLDEYHWLIEHGFFQDNERVELIGGLLHQMSPEGPRHVAAIDRLLHLFFNRVGDRALVRVQHPILLPENNSEPEPDLVLAKRREDFYGSAHPVATDIILVVEVAASSLLEDRQLKVPVYAAAGIAEYWIVNLVEDQIEVYQEPTIPAKGAPYYHQHLRFSAQDRVHPANFPDWVIPVEEVLPPRSE